MSKVTAIAKHYVSWHAKSLVFDLLLIAIFIASKSFWDLKDMEDLMTLGLLVKIFSGIGLRSNIRVAGPKQCAAGQRQFNIKFLQSLPLSKRQLPMALGLCSLASGLPLFVYVAFFYPLLTKNAGFLPTANFAPPFFMAAVVLVYLGFSFFMLKASITLPRTLSQKIPKTLYYFKSYNFLCLLGMVPLAFIFLIRGTVDLVKIPSIKPLLAYAYFGIVSLKEPQNLMIAFVAAAALLAYAAHRSSIKALVNERKGYVNVKKSLAVHGFLSFSLIAGLCNMDIFFSHDYYKGKAQSLVKEKNLEELKSLVQKEGVKVLNAPNEYGLTSLLVAVHEGDVEMYRELKKMGAKHDAKMRLNLPGHRGMGLAFFALDSHKIEMFEEILKEKPNGLGAVNKENGNTLLHYASHNCKIELVDYLLKKNLDPNVKNKSGQTPLHLAASKGCIGPIISLYDKGARLDEQDGKGQVALDYKAVKKNKELSYYLQKRMRLPASN